MSTPKSEVMNTVKADYRGVLVIGDPWLGSQRRVGRVDLPWDASFAKLEQALEIAKSRSLLPIIVGDLLHEHRDIGQLLPIINLLKEHKPMLMPRKWRWEDRAEKHIAAILRAAGIAQVIGKDAKRIQLVFRNDEMDSKFTKMHLDCYTSWGGVEDLEPGASAYIKIPEMKISVVQSSSLPTLEDVDGDTCVVAGRLLRLSPSEEGMSVMVTEITPKGVDLIPLEIKPIVFSSAATGSEETQRELDRESRFVEQLRASTQGALEDEGKESLLDLIDNVCEEHSADDYIKTRMLELAKEVAAQ